MERYNNTIQESNGDIITTATVTVYLSSSGAIASIFADNETTALNNPFTVSDSNYDTDGSFWFKADDALYDIKVVNGSDTTWVYDETLIDIDTYGGTTPSITDNGNANAITIDSAENTSFTNNIYTVDSKGIYLGSGNDCVFTHNGTNTHIQNSTGTFQIDCKVNSGLFNITNYDSSGVEKVCFTCGGAAPNVILKYNAVQKFQTTSDGIEVGTYSSTGASTGYKYFQSAADRRSSSNSTGTSNHLSFYNPNGQVGRISTNASATTYSTSSDKNLKTSYGLCDNSASIINKLEVHDYSFKSDDTNTIKRGVMAQDAYKVYPEAITKPVDGNEFWGADYSKFVPILIANVQELNAKIERLELELNKRNVK